MTAIDPICKMKVEESKAKLTSDYQGKKYYFCSAGCKATFERDPKKFA
ncbi:MAG TPA: YHS domain-containing protein [Nitrososphaerales archaeon]|nr:YHS domain-containing protein [Nitrososphaerales archaeon]